jgi:hypothetical protein
MSRRLGTGGETSSCAQHPFAAAAESMGIARADAGRLQLRGGTTNTDRAVGHAIWTMLLAQ